MLQKIECGDCKLSFQDDGGISFYTNQNRSCECAVCEKCVGDYEFDSENKTFKCAHFQSVETTEPKLCSFCGTAIEPFEGFLRRAFNCNHFPCVDCFKERESENEEGLMVCTICESLQINKKVDEKIVAQQLKENAKISAAALKIEKSVFDRRVSSTQPKKQIKLKMCDLHVQNEVVQVCFVSKCFYNNFACKECPKNDHFVCKNFLDIKQYLKQKMTKMSSNLLSMDRIYSGHLSQVVTIVEECLSKDVSKKIIEKFEPSMILDILKEFHTSSEQYIADAHEAFQKFLNRGGKIVKNLESAAGVSFESLKLKTQNEIDRLMQKLYQMRQNLKENFPAKQKQNFQGKNYEESLKKDFSQGYLTECVKVSELNSKRVFKNLYTQIKESAAENPFNKFSLKQLNLVSCDWKDSKIEAADLQQVSVSSVPKNELQTEHSKTDQGKKFQLRRKTVSEEFKPEVKPNEVEKTVLPQTATKGNSALKLENSKPEKTEKESKLAGSYPNIQNQKSVDDESFLPPSEISRADESTRISLQALDTKNVPNSKFKIMDSNFIKLVWTEILNQKFELIEPPNQKSSYLSFYAKNSDRNLLLVKTQTPIPFKKNWLLTIKIEKIKETGPIDPQEGHFTIGVFECEQSVGKDGKKALATKNSVTRKTYFKVFVENLEKQTLEKMIWTLEYENGDSESALFIHKTDDLNRRRKPIGKVSDDLYLFMLISPNVEMQFKLELQELVQKTDIIKHFDESM